MAKKRKYKKRKQVKQSNNINVAIIVTIVISILLAVLICLDSEAGNVGQAISSFLGGMMGWLKYILPFGMIVIAINLACKGKGYLSSKITQYLRINLSIKAKDLHSENYKMLMKKPKMLQLERYSIFWDWKDQ